MAGAPSAAKVDMTNFKPYIAPEEQLPELTMKVIGLGFLLAVVFAAANAYLGLYVGMTVSASIPAAVISMAIFRALKGNILENNMVKTSAAAGEAVAAGIIFTIPALLYLFRTLTWDETSGAGTAGWEDLSGFHMVEIGVIALVGGMLGVLFSIPLRRILIIDMDLPYPEGVACTEVLKTGEEGGKGVQLVFGALSLGALFKLCGSATGLKLWKEEITHIFREEARARFFFGSNLSPALLGVGWIIGPRIAAMVFGGGVIGWLIAIPLVGYYRDWTYNDIMWGGEAGIFAVWRADTLYIGIGAIIVGGLYTMFKMRSAIITGVKQGASASSSMDEFGEEVIRTEKDLPWKLWYFAIIFVAMLAVYWHVTEDGVITVVAAIVMLIFAFFFTAVAGYIAGVVGSSNNPVSGVTVATLLFTAILLVLLGADKSMGMTATILVAAIICVSAAIAGDCMQELKTGQLLGSTPRNLQIAEVIGVVAAALIIGPVLFALDEAYVIFSENLAAPQGVVMATVVFGVFEGNMNWTFFIIGVLLAFGIIALEKFNIAQISIMAVAIGIYLPLMLTTPIMIGGLIRMFADKFVENKIEVCDTELYPTEEQKGAAKAAAKEKSYNDGVLIASGLIAGEALMGVMIAMIVIADVELNVFNDPPGGPGLLLYIYIMVLLAFIVLRDHIITMQRSQIGATFRGVMRDAVNGVKAVPGLIARAFAGAHLDPPPAPEPSEGEGVLDAEEVQE